MFYNMLQVLWVFIIEVAGIITAYFISINMPIISESDWYGDVMRGERVKVSSITILHLVICWIFIDFHAVQEL